MASPAVPTLATRAAVAVRISNALRAAAGQRLGDRPRHHGPRAGRHPIVGACSAHRFQCGLQQWGGACQRWGYSVPFDVGTLDDLHPAHERYVQRVTRLTQDNVRRRYILERDAQQTIREAVESRVGGRDDGPSDEDD